MKKKTPSASATAPGATVVDAAPAPTGGGEQLRSKASCSSDELEFMKEAEALLKEANTRVRYVATVKFINYDKSFGFLTSEEIEFEIRENHV